MPTVLSITLVLFLTGLLGLIGYKARLINDYFRENFQLRVYLTPDADLTEGVNLNLFYKSQEQVKSSEFVSKDEAAEAEIQLQGFDFIETLGFNPLPHSIHITLHSAYTDAQFIREWVQELEKNPLVDQVAYSDSILQLVNENLRIIEWVILAILIAFLLATLFIINNTIRLNVFARRFLIKSMQYVGATDWFIIKPFIKMYAFQGLIGALLAIALNALVVGAVASQYPGIIELEPLTPFFYIALVLISFSFVIILPSTYLACKKYLKLDINKLY